MPHDVQVRELGSGRSRLEVLQEAGLNIKIAQKMSVDDGIQAVRRFNVPSVKVGLDCLRNYRREYDEKRKVFYDRPLHDWSSHGADAFRYLAIGLDESSKWGSSINKPPKWIV